MLSSVTPELVEVEGGGVVWVVLEPPLLGLLVGVLGLLVGVLEPPPLGWLGVLGLLVLGLAVVVVVVLELLLTLLVLVLLFVVFVGVLTSTFIVLR